MLVGCPWCGLLHEAQTFLSRKVENKEVHSKVQT